VRYDKSVADARARAMGANPAAAAAAAAVNAAAAAKTAAAKAAAAAAAKEEKDGDGAGMGRSAINAAANDDANLEAAAELYAVYQPRHVKAGNQQGAHIGQLYIRRVH